MCLMFQLPTFVGATLHVIFGNENTHIYLLYSAYNVIMAICEWQVSLQMHQQECGNPLILPSGSQNVWDSMCLWNSCFIFFVQVKLVEVVSQLSYVTVYHLTGNSDFQEKVISSIVFVCLNDEDVRVRHAAAKAVVR